MKESTATEHPGKERGWRPDVIDLSRPLTLETVYALFADLVADEDSYFRQIRISTAMDFTTANATSCYLSIPDHVGTHMDVPVHTIEGGYALERADISRLIGTAVVLDLDRGGIDYAYTPVDLKNAGPGVEAGDIVLVYSGFRDARVTERMRQTYFTVEAAEWLVERGVHAVGVEPCSPDHVYDGLFVHGWADPLNLEHVLRVYVSHFNQQRPHRTLDLRPPDHGSGTDPPPTASLHARQVRRRDLLGGLLHEYEKAA